MKKLKNRLYVLVDESSGHPISNQFGTLISYLILLSVLAIIMESYAPLQQRFEIFFRVFEVLTVLIFTFEYLVRWWTADLRYGLKGQRFGRWRFFISSNGIIDLLAILPFYLPLVVGLDLRFLRILRLMRLLRILKLNRYSRALKLVGTIFWEKREDLSVTVMVTFVLMLLSSSLMYFLEHDVQPEAFPNILASFWWSIATLTTVGYGDVYPITGFGRLVAGIIALLGIGLVALPTGIISSAFLEKMQQKNQEPQQAGMNYCPHCGKPLHGS